MKSDRRVRYTRMVLKQALLSLMLERPITRITVTEICERAEVNRATFYAHYADPYDLLARIETNCLNPSGVPSRADFLRAASGGS